MPVQGPGPLRAAIVGTGYIADFHAQAIASLDGVRLVGICDTNRTAAHSFAEKWQITGAFESFDSLLKSQSIDSVHILAPPDHHYSLAKAALDAGAHVFLEKPMCTSVEQADELIVIARKKGLYLGVNHNMLFAAPYRQLQEVVRSGSIGPILHVSCNHFLELGHLRFGPFSAWMLQQHGNLLLELGPHLYSAVLDLVGKPEYIQATADRSVDLPGQRRAFRRWRINATAGRTAIDINIDLSPGICQRTIYVRGLTGTATVDFDANTCTIDRPTALGIDFDRYSRSRTLCRQIRSQSRQTIADYLLSKLKLRNRGSPYHVTFLDSVAAFYAAIRSGTAVENGLDARMGRDVVEVCNKTLRAAGIGPGRCPEARPAAEQNLLARRPSVLVLGGTGFIGRELIRQLLAAGYSVRAMVRSTTSLLDEFADAPLELLRGDIGREQDLITAMEGVEYVYHLARADAKTWEEYEQRDVEPSRLVAQACLQLRIRRLVYTGTIDSYYAGAKAATITEATPLDPNIRRRNYYARAKAAAESILMDMHRTNALPVVICRPGIVIGPGGNPFHWGVGMWTAASICGVWGQGRNPLPFVLVQDVATALIRCIQVPGIEGRSYNLVDQPLLTARDYLDEFRRLSGISVTAQYRSIYALYAVDFLKWVVKVGVGHPDRRRIPSYHDWESRTQKAIFDCGRARSELNWTPVSDKKRLVELGIGGSLESWLNACR